MRVRATYKHPFSGKFLGSSEQDRPYDERGWRLFRLGVTADLDFHHGRLQRKEGMLPRPKLELLGVKQSN